MSKVDIKINGNQFVSHGYFVLHRNRVYVVDFIDIENNSVCIRKNHRVIKAKSTELNPIPTNIDSITKLLLAEKNETNNDYQIPLIPDTFYFEKGILKIKQCKGYGRLKDTFNYINEVQDLIH